MRFRIGKATLSTLSSRYNATSADKNGLHFGLKVDDNTLEMSLIDQHLGIFCSGDCEALEEGIAFVQAKLFLELIRELPNTDLEFKTSGGFLEISGAHDDSFELRLALIGNQIWNGLPDLEGFDAMTLETQALGVALQNTVYCLSPESTRNFAGVAFVQQRDKETLRMVATDGFRLSYSDLKCENPIAGLLEGICLTKRCLQEIQRMVKEPYEQITLGLSTDQSSMQMRLPGYVVMARLSNLRYPDYATALGASDRDCFSISSERLTESLRRVLLAADREKHIDLAVDESGRLTIKSHSTRSSSGKESLNLSRVPKGPGNFCINGKYLTDALSVLDGDESVFHFKKGYPLRIVSSKEWPNVRSSHILMPITEN